MYLRVRYGEEQFPNVKIDVLNRGKGGEEAIEELVRFGTDIFAEHDDRRIVCHLPRVRAVDGLDHRHLCHRGSQWPLEAA